MDKYIKAIGISSNYSGHGKCESCLVTATILVDVIYNTGVKQEKWCDGCVNNFEQHCANEEHIKYE